MKVELIKMTTAIFGNVYYYVKANGSFLTSTWTSDAVKARATFLEIIEKTKANPNDSEQVIDEVEA